jgi:hypothetical protein
VSFDIAKLWEMAWIKALRNQGYNLVNMTDGGDGTLGLKRTDSIFYTNNPSKLQKNKNRMIYNNPMKDPEIAMKVAKTLTGRKISPEIVEKVSFKLRGVFKTEDHNIKNSVGCKKAWSKLTSDQRRERGIKRKQAHAKVSAEERSAIVRKGWETRRGIR